MSLFFLGDFYYNYSVVKNDILEISKFIQENNFKVILNLEGPITNSNLEIKKRGEHLKQSPLSLEILKALNVVGVSLANNHIMDFGEAGLKETIDVLHKNGIQCAGAGLSLNEAFTPLVIEDDGIIYKIFCMTDSYEEAVIANHKSCGCAPIMSCQNLKKNENEHVVFFLHSGFEYNTLPMPRNIKESKEFIDNGVDVVLTTHPHLVQPMLTYKNKSIYFSLGNFYFSTFRTEFNNKAIKNKKQGFCNISYGVELGKKESTFLIKYYPHKKKTKIIGKCFISNISGHRSNFDYIRQCYANRNNHNPILTGNRLHDQIVLQLLKLLYFVYGVLRKLKSIVRP